MINSSKTKAEIMEEQISLLCQECGMYAEIKDGVVYITTIVAEWFFILDERPIKLRHKNYSDDIYGAEIKNINDHYHLQDGYFSSPLHAIKYICAHDIFTKDRLMENNDTE